MTLNDYLTQKKTLVEEYLKKSLDEDLIPSRLAESMKYSLRAGGKRLRPILVIAGAEAVGGKVEDVMPLAIALEMIHTFSLIHDDLPAMDNDDLRRGKPTNHKVYGDAMAILAGDGLLAEAFYYLTTNAKSGEESKYLKAAKLLAKATGCRGMTGGQAIDMESAGKNLSIEELEHLHNLKTGALITVSVVGGGMLAGATNEQLNALKNYGDKLGLAFQIADDVLDIVGDENEIGKPVGSDITNDKSTYPALLGLDGAKKLAKVTSDVAIEALEGFDDKAWMLRDLADYVISRSK